MAIAPELSKQQIKQNRFLLHLIAVSSLSLGLLVWSAAPFIFPGKPANSRLFRYMSLIWTMGAGISLSYCSVKLSRNQALYQAVELNDKSEYIDLLSRAEIAREDYNQLLVTDRLRSVTSEKEALPPEPIQDERLRGNGNGNGNELPALLPVVNEAITQGKSDSFIIKNILGYEGRNFPDGKELLAEIKELIEAQEES